MHAVTAPAEAAPTEAVASRRVAGWDLLRGLCAVAVALYHLLIWQNVASIETFGTYGVYMFFMLSGASLAYTYAGRIDDGSFRVTQFLFVRYLRLAPLYILLMLLILPLLQISVGPVDRLAWLLFLNTTFLYGVWNPSVNAIVPAGWSLGIEAMFYLLFPFLMRSFVSWRKALALFMLLLILQGVWIAGTLGEGAWAFRERDYHQAPAFAGYFMAGCILGVLQLRAGARLVRKRRGGVALLLAGFAVLFALNTAEAGQQMLGWRGFALPVLCFVMVGLSGTLSFKGYLGGAARHLGDATYGLYLIHPILFFYFLPAITLGHSEDWPLHARWVMTALVLACAFLLALASERFFEQPLRRWSKSRKLFSPAAMAAPPPASGSAKPLEQAP